MSAGASRHRRQAAGGGSGTASAGASQQRHRAVGGGSGTAPFRVLPRLDEGNRPFWTAGERGELAMQRCGDCGYLVHPPGPLCPRCLSRSLAPSVLSGRGAVHSFTVNHQRWNPTMPAPYVVGLIELDEQPGLRLMTNIVGCEPDEVTIGMRVRVTFEQHDDVWVPLFAPEGRQRQSAPEGRQRQSAPEAQGGLADG